MKVASPAWKTVRRPMRSPIAPASSMRLASTIVYAAIVHCSPATEACSWRPIDGTARHRQAGYQSDNAGTRAGHPALEPGGPPPALVAGKPQVGLADGEPGDGPADDHPLDFRGASKMVKLLGLMTHD